MVLSLCACAQADFLWREAEGGRSKGALVTSFNTPASAALLCGAVAQLLTSLSALRAGCGKLEGSRDAAPGPAFCITAFPG